MKTRQTTIQAFAAHLLPGTDVYPIHIKNPISRIIIPYSVLTTATCRIGHMSRTFSRIVIVDGSDVLLSLTGPQIDGIARMDAVSATATFEQPDATTTVWGNLVIDFGRYLYDKEIAFEPAKFKNPQIQVTHDAAACSALGVRTDYAILADIMEGLTSSPRGFLMKKEIKSWVAALPAWEYTDMPQDYPYRRIWLQALTSYFGPAAHWSRAILQEDNYARVPFDSLIDDQVADNAADYGLITEHVTGNISNPAFPVFAAPIYSGRIMVVNTFVAANLFAQNQDGEVYTVVSAGLADVWRGAVEGLTPHGLVVFNMGPVDVIEDWYDPTVIGHLQLEVLGAGPRTIRLVTEQLRPNEPR